MNALQIAKAELITVLAAHDYSVTAHEVIIPEASLGDLALACFSIAKKHSVPPPQAAKQTTELINSYVAATPDSLLSGATAVGPYLNITLRRSAFAALITVDNDLLATIRQEKPERLLVEFISPNTNKPLHIGHLRNACLGWSISELLKAEGHEVIRAEIINDRGVHIMKSLLAYERWGNSQTPETANKKSDHFVGDYYVQFANEAKQNPDLDAEVLTYLQRWEAGDEALRKLWQQMNTWAEEGQTTTCKRLGIAFDRVDYESNIYEAGRKLVEEAAAAGLATKKDDGSIVAPITTASEEGPKEKVLLRGDGTTVYITQDLALAALRMQELRPARMLFVVAQEQDYHFTVLFELLERFHVVSRDNVEHVSYHLVSLPEGRMKSREGTVADIDPLLDELMLLAKTELKNRTTELTEAEYNARAETIALAAAKFYMLSVRPSSDITFNPKESLSFTGKTGPYLLYTHARLRSILRKAGAAAGAQTPATLTDAEWGVIKTIGLLPETVSFAAKHRDPSRIADYAYTLARAIAAFYEADPVLTADEATRTWRLTLLTKADSALVTALSLLGIQTLEEM
ncbi:MAG: arginine--tRNA ligase [Patescibacteria group bacterium]